MRSFHQQEKGVENMNKFERTILWLVGADDVSLKHFYNRSYIQRSVPATLITSYLVYISLILMQVCIHYFGFVSALPIIIIPILLIKILNWKIWENHHRAKLSPTTKKGDLI